MIITDYTLVNPSSLTRLVLEPEYIICMSGLQPGNDKRQFLTQSGYYNEERCSNLLDKTRQIHNISTITKTRLAFTPTC